jgi:hypothetical protein
MKTLVTIALVGIALLVATTPAAAAPATPAAAPSTTCGWPLKADPDLVNIAWPDESASYWAAPFYAAPGSTMTIQGRFPLARYMSFHLYEGSMPVDAVTDYQLQPAAGTNPYVAGAPRALGGTYVLHVVYGQRPQNPAPNTLYAASLNGEPNVAGLILYRLYLPQGDATGQVPLPEVHYTGATGASALPCPDTSSVDNGSLNQIIRSSSLPVSWPSQVPPTSTAPTWGISRSAPSTTSAGPVGVRTGNPFFANFDNVYLSLDAYRDRGDVVAFRAKAPTFAQTSGAQVMPSAQVRYWSICSNDFPTTRYVACTPDQGMRLDRQGFFTVVISDPAHKPSNLLPSDNWLPAGPYPDIFVLYRQMLPETSFAQAIQFAPSASGAPETMGAYYPDTRICSTAAFEQSRCGLPTVKPSAAKRRAL